MPAQPSPLHIVGTGRQRRRRRRRVLTRAVPIVILAGAATIFGVYEAGASGRDERRVVGQYAAEFAASNYHGMYRMLTPASRRRMTLSEFERRLGAAAETATSTGLRAGKVISVGEHQAKVAFTVHTRIFGDLNETLTVPVSGSGSGSQITYSSSLLMPGMLPGETLTRKPLMGQRGTLLAANGQVLAQGSSLYSPIPAVAGQIAGSLGPIPADQAAFYKSEGYPADAQIGQDGLEAVFQTRLAGKLGGDLYSGRRLLARAAPGNGQTVRTTIDPTLEEDAVASLGNSYAGITVMKPNGDVEAAAEIAYTDVQPPGSTFKIVTATAALQAGITSIDHVYPYESSTYVGGFKMQNAAGEVCGGTLLNAFATSCDTTFAPIGVQLGARRLVSMAEKFGFDEPVKNIPTAYTSTIPPAADIGGATAIGASAIGQGDVQASTLQMADVAATIADRGRRPVPTMLATQSPQYVHVTTPAVAADVQKMMIAVVSQYNGTGTTAQIPGVEVAGKTGTAELSDTAGKKNDKKATDSWFVAYAPAQDPKVIVCALFPSAGYGADTAAPAVRSVIEDALGIG